MNKPRVSPNTDGNIFSVLAAASEALRKAKVPGVKAEEMRQRVFKSKSYDEALQIVMDYVDFGAEEASEEDEDEEAIRTCNRCSDEFKESDLKEGYCPMCYDEWYANNEEGEDC